MKITDEQVEFIDKVFRQGVKIRCPKCLAQHNIYHPYWSALICITCKGEIQQEEWDVL